MFIVPSLFAAITVFGITPLVIVLAKKYRLVDDPKTRKHPAQTHTGVIPRAGGLALFIGITIATLLFLPFTKLILGMLLGSAILVVVGLIDDHHDINPYFRLVTNAIATLLVIAGGTGIPYITNPLAGNLLHLDTWRITFSFMGTHSILVWADLFAFVWIMWTMNIVGWSSGVDGQMPGFVAISALVIGFLSLRFVAHDVTQTTVTMLSFIVAGAFVGFIPWNFYPQKIMPGYGGKTLAGFLLAFLSILSYAKLGTALLVLSIPTIDAISTLVRRLGKGKSPVWADRGHFHHHLLDLGWGKRRIALFYWTASAILGLLALSVSSKQKVFAFLLIAVLIGGFWVWVNFFMHVSKQPDPDNG